MKVRSYLALFTGAVLIPVIAFSAAALILLLKAERDALSGSFHETARAIALAVDRELSNSEAALTVLATSGHLASGDLEHFYAQAVAANRGSGSWTVLFDDAGRQLINTRLPFGAPLPDTANPKDAALALQASAPLVSNLRNGPVSGKPVIGVGLATAPANGRRYIVAQTFLAEHFNKTFPRNLPPGWIVGILDREGNTVARNISPERFVGTPVRPELMAVFRAADEGEHRHMSRDGVYIHDVFAHSTLSGWTVAVGVPVADMEAAARRAIAIGALGLLAALCCAGGLGIYIGRRLVRSIAAAERSAAALGRGDMPEPAATGVAEIDRLHAAQTEAARMLRQEKDSRAQAEAERAALLASEQEARRFAEIQNKAKDEFLAMLGHELRNPLSAISGAVSVMELGRDPHSAARAQAVISRQSKHLSRIVDDLLELSRMMAGKLYLQKQPLELGQVVRDCVEAVKAANPADLAAMPALQLDVREAWVQADPTRLEQLVSNLLGNAIKYTGAGGRIEVAVRNEAEHAVLEVRDTGIGIPAELLPHVFESFVQGQDALDRSRGGLGVGLALVQQIVRLHGGTVTAESEGPDRGSTFTVRLPHVAATLRPEGTGPDSAARGRRRILLVEDNDDARQMLAAVLQLYGHEVLEASSGTAGVEMAEKELPQVAVIDIGLPGIDGYQVANRLRAGERTRGMRLIALTGYGQDADRQRARLAGFDAHLVKPVDFAELAKAIA